MKRTVALLYLALTTGATSSLATNRLLSAIGSDAELWFQRSPAEKRLISRGCVKVWTRHRRSPEK